MVLYIFSFVIVRKNGALVHHTRVPFSRLRTRPNVRLLYFLTEGAVYLYEESSRISFQLSALRKFVIGLNANIHSTVQVSKDARTRET
jgi:hypothetical protein